MRSGRRSPGACDCVVTVRPAYGLYWLRGTNFIVEARWLEGGQVTGRVRGRPAPRLLRAGLTYRIRGAVLHLVEASWLL